MKTLMQGDGGGDVGHLVMRNNSIWKWLQLQCTCLLRYPKLFTFYLTWSWTRYSWWMEGKWQVSLPADLLLTAEFTEVQGRFLCEERTHWVDGEETSQFWTRSVGSKGVWFPRWLIVPISQTWGCCKTSCLPACCLSCFHCHFKMCYT
jgi:hypothetical protein